MSVAEFLRGLKFGEEHDWTDCDGKYDVCTWTAHRHGAGHAPVLYMYIEVENIATGNKTYHRGDIQSQAELSREVESLIKKINEDEDETYGIQVIYTGGGIWLAIKRLESDPHVYAVVDDEWENCVTYYDDRGDDYEFACQQMVDSRSDDEMSDADKVLYETLYAALERESY